MLVVAWCLVFCVCCWALFVACGLLRCLLFVAVRSLLFAVWPLPFVV